jgi:hypothetical protein
LLQKYFSLLPIVDGAIKKEKMFRIVVLVLFILSGGKSSRYTLWEM